MDSGSSKLLEVAHRWLENKRSWEKDQEFLKLAESILQLMSLRGATKNEVIQTIVFALLGGCASCRLPLENFNQLAECLKEDYRNNWVEKP